MYQLYFQRTYIILLNTDTCVDDFPLKITPGDLSVVGFTASTEDGPRFPAGFAVLFI